MYNMNIMKRNRLLLFVSLLLLLFLVDVIVFLGLEKILRMQVILIAKTNNIIASLLEEFEEEDVE